MSYLRIPCVKINGILCSVLTITAKRNYIFGRIISLISKVDIALEVKILVILYIPTPALLEVVHILTLTVIMCVRNVDGK